VSSILADVEVKRALDRLRARGADPSDHLRGFFLIDLSRDVRDLAAKVAPELRSLDAVHLATALSLDVDLDFVTYDDRLAAAARAEGLRVVQPGR
jgi:predicted nucleic acid-binding protein